ncbi:carotenoid ester lipase [Daedaleopsis nitida]|nr:carotenoid ester lipase [Daedaleopsis nitida]
MLAVTLTVPLERSHWPTVALDNAIVIGNANGTLTRFLGIPFAQAPVGDLRLRLPKPVVPYTGVINATAFGNQCIQQTSPPPSLPSNVPSAAAGYLPALDSVPNLPQSEDCLNINIIAPANATPSSRLPVAVWIYGGGFSSGSNIVRPGEVIVARSMEIGHPVIYASMNYRLAAFGFLGGREVKEAKVGNLGMHDQREALRWIQKYISAFGGDSSKVMIWGESAGANSVALHMLTDGGNPHGLFHAGFMESGATRPTGFIDNPYMQTTYDSIVQDTGCSNARDTLGCLRTVSADALTAAMDKVSALNAFKQINGPWIPRADGVFVAEPPDRVLLTGKVARIPIVIGNDRDEGTAFSFPTLNLTTDLEFLDYLNSNFYVNTSRQAVAKLLDLYPGDPAAGSPFGTGDAFAYSPQYKRMAALQGDLFQQAPRRLFVRTLSSRQPVYSYLSDMNRVEGLGAAHGTELANVFGGGDMGDYLIRFAATLDPNTDDAVHWPRYMKTSPSLLTFNDSDGAQRLSITLDTYRGEEMEYLTKLSLADPM